MEKPTNNNVKNLSRNEARKYIHCYGDQVMIVPYELLKPRPGAGTDGTLFNWRKPAPYQTTQEWEKELNLEELAEGIFQNNGPHDPIQGDLVEIGDSKEVAL